MFRISRGPAAIPSMVVTVAVVLATTGVARADTPTPATSNPQLSGTATAGQTLSFSESWTTTDPVTVSNTADTWFDCQAADTSSNCSQIAGAAGESYTLQSSDVGSYVYAMETASASDGSDGTVDTSFAGPISPAVPDVPVNAGAPTISGTAVENETLTGTDGSWSNSPTGYTYQWEDCDSNGANCTPIANATNSRYVLGAGDLGHTVELAVTASNAGGPSVASSSPPSAVVATADAMSVPAVSGSPVQGQTLTASTGTWSFTPTSYTYQWLRCTSAAACTNSGASGPTVTSYSLNPADVDDTIKVQVTAGDGTVSAVATSPPTARIQPPAPSNSAAPGISGTAQIGHTLTEVPGHWSADAAFPTSVVVDWYRCASSGTDCVKVATGAQYALTTADIGATLQVGETASNATGKNVAYSSLTAAVTNAAGLVPVPAVTSAPDVSGAARFGSTLTATRAGFSGNPGTYAYQWRRCSLTECLDIPGATSLTYVATAADVGYALQIVERATNGGGMSSFAQSPNTAVVTAPSTTILRSSVARPVAGQSVSLIAAVSSPAASLEAGTITFSADGKAIPGCAGLALPADPTQPVICRTSFAAASHAVIAGFTPDAGTYVTGSASPGTTLAVRRVPTTISLGAGSRILLGRRVTYRATVQPASSGSLKPAGRVAFLDGTKPIVGCARRRLHGVAATCSVRYLGLRTHTISVRYRGDADFAAARSAGRRITVAAERPTGVVTAYMSWTFAYGPAGTMVRKLSVSGLVTGTRITMTCSGGGCAFRNYARTISVPARCRAHRRCRTASSLNLTPAFKRDRLHVGTHLTVKLSHPRWVGKYYRFTIRHSRQPALQESCLAVGGTRPSVGCSARA